MSFIAEDSENKAIVSSKVGKVGLGSEDGLMGSGEMWVVSVGGLEGFPVGGSDEGSEGGFL